MVERHRFSVRLDEEVERHADLWVEVNGGSKAALIRRALKEWLEARALWEIGIGRKPHAEVSTENSGVTPTNRPLTVDRNGHA